MKALNKVLRNVYGSALTCDITACREYLYEDILNEASKEELSALLDEIQAVELYYRDFTIGSQQTLRMWKLPKECILAYSRLALFFGATMYTQRKPSLLCRYMLPRVQQYISRQDVQRSLPLDEGYEVVSDTLMDMRYACGYDDKMSLRLYAMLRL